MRRVRQRLHFMNGENEATLVQICHRKRNQCIAHPHGVVANVREDKQHALMFTHFLPVHQTRLARDFRAGNVGAHALATCL